MARQSLVTTTGTLGNSTSANLTRSALQKWDGRLIKSPPSSIRASGRATFEHTAISAPGARAAVLYTGRKGGRDCAWLFAWHNARGGVRKVFAQCGARSQFNNINWANVATQLDRAGSSVSVRDQATGTRVTGNIIGTTGQSVVTASFY